MTLRERLLAVFRGQTPDVVPLYADLSHWHVASSGGSFLPIRTADSALDLSLFDLHKELRIGCYSTGTTLFEVRYEGDVEETIGVQDGLFRHVIRTPLGRIEEQRRYSPVSLSYDIIRRMIQGLDDLRALNYAYRHRRAVPAWGSYEKFERLIGDNGIVGAFGGYSGLGFLMSRYMGIEATVYALADHPREVEETIELINHARLEEMAVLVKSPAPVVFFSDNLSSDIHTPPLFQRYMSAFYTRLAQMCHAEGKRLSVHVDGRIRGLLRCLRECGVDSVDAVTPAPDGDLTPQQAREEAGPDLILWGGIPASIWQEFTPDEQFVRYVREYLELRWQSPRLVLAPYDQAVPGTPRRRLEMMHELVEKHGRYD